MKKQEVEKVDVEKIIKGEGNLGELLRALDTIEPVKEVVPVKQSAETRRKAKWLKQRDGIEPTQLANLRKKMNTFFSSLTRVHVEEPRELTEEEATLLMQELVAGAELAEAYEARREDAKRMVFNSLTAQNRAAGVKDPEQHNGVIEVPKVGKQFIRQGTGRKDPQLNPLMLQKLLSPEDWELISKKTVIPEHVVYEIDEDRLKKFLHANPRAVELLRKSLIPGEWKSPSFSIRDL